MAADEEETLTIVPAVLNGIWSVPLLILWVLALFLARRRGDPARVAFAWLKVALPFGVLNAVLHIVPPAAALALYQYYNSRNGRLSDTTAQQLQLASLRTDALAIMFERITSALILVTFVELGNGFMYARTHRRAGWQKALRFLSYFLAVVLLALAAAACGTSMDAIERSYQNRLTRAQYASRIAVSNQINAAFDVLYWISTIPMVAYAAVVVHLWRRHPSARGIAIEFLVATILNFVRSTWGLAFDATFIINRDVYVVVPRYIAYIDPVLNMQPLGVIFVLLFVIGVRKRKGLWTTSQPFHGGVAPVAGVDSKVHELPFQQQQWQPYGNASHQPAYGGPGQGQGPVGWQPQQQQQPYQLQAA